MNLSRKLKRKIKKDISTTLASVALVTATLATLKLTGFSTPANMLNLIQKDNTKTATTINRLQNTEKITYIYDAQDFVSFRNAVNAGDNYSGKTVYLMDDIDLSTVCSSTLGSFTPIGATDTYFGGIFDGNYHTISNLYINSNAYLNLGLFNITTKDAIIRNLVMENIDVYSSYNVTSAYKYAGGIVGYNYGIITNCGINSGTVKNEKTSNNTNSSIYPSARAGGITGGNEGTISNCYNKGNSIAIAPSASSYNEAFAGGIVGYSTRGQILNCYNTGTIQSSSYAAYSGGIAGGAQKSVSTDNITNAYNIGKITTSGKKYNYCSGVIGRNGWSSTYKYMAMNNIYCLDNTTYSYYYYSGSTKSSTAGKVSAATLQTYTVTLGNAFAYDVYQTNNGYPVLAWENKTTVMQLNKNQAYIGVGENIALNIQQDDDITKIIDGNYSTNNFTWTSTNEDVAIVNSNGVVTGISDGYTCIYAYHKASGMYAMCVVNVAKNFTNPQIETGNGFTTILKADGTVWTIGKNDSGELGNGTTENSKLPVQVKIDEDTNLDNIVKISVGTDHVLALTKNGKVYAWGLNTSGQLGQNNTTSSNYAKLVLSSDGTTYLTGIVDISAGAYGSVALDKNGDVYVWGNGTYGEIGNNATESKNLPTKTTIKNGVQVSIGQGQLAVLTSEGVVWSWGRNDNGELGINCMNNTSYPMKTAINITEVTSGAVHTSIKKIDGEVYATGCNNNGRLGTGDITTVIKYTKVNLPSVVTEKNKVKYIKSGKQNTTILLEDDSVWETGYNVAGELAIGTTTLSTTFVQGLTENNTPINNVLTIGKNNGDPTDGMGSLNTAVITKNGDVYTTGDNTYGQIGDNTTTNSNYYKRMGFAYLHYEDKSVEIGKEGYQIDLNKLKYIYSSINVYNNEQTYSLGDIKYTSLNETIAIVDENGKITAKDGVSGITKIKIQDVTNGYETDFTIVLNKLENTDTITYIYTTEDMMKFRDNVNAGDTYAGKTVYLMADIDMSSACSSTLGSWTPIGTANTSFAGTFDGNYHTISNLYINSNAYLDLGLFTVTTKDTIIQNLVMENMDVYSSYNVTSAYKHAGGIVGYNYGIITNCGINSGIVKNEKTSTNTNSGIFPSSRAGGISGGNEGIISNCYNKGTSIAIAPSGSKYNEAFAGGIVGYSTRGQILNCYNTGTIQSSSYAAYSGGIAGGTEKGASTDNITNAYNVGKITTSGKGYNYCSGVIGRNGWSSKNKYMAMNNIYCLDNTTYSYYYYSGTTKSSTAGRVTSDTLKTYATTLGTAFENDDFSINSEYPILWWEVPTIELNKKQEYIKVKEELQLNIIQTNAVTSIIGENITASDFTWTSANEDVATVNENGLVTGLKDGYTTIYAYHEKSNLYTMAIVNVAKDVANPQIETGEGFSVILKADGTVWTIGKNENGTLGNGTNEDAIEAVQVKIDENTYLNNVIKISAGTNHVLALTKDKKVYAWGENTYGQLGQNNTESSNYAKLVLAEGGSTNLDRIVDISAGNYGSTALNEFGWVYAWGNGTYGEMGNGRSTSNYTPTKTTLNTSISVSMGAGHAVSIGQNGNAYTWGRNTYGELGTGNTTNSNTVTKIAEATTEVSSAGYETILKKADGSMYTAGLNTNGQLANGTIANKTSFTKMTLPSTLTTNNKVKYVKAGRTTTTLMLDDATVWTVGNNTSGELGNKTNIASSSFVQALTKDGTLENTLIIGRNSGETTSLNTAVINESGRVYTSGSNTYGQIGNNTKDDTNYFTVMGYNKVIYPEKITMHVGEHFELTEENFAYVEKYFNVYKEDIKKVPLLANAKVLDTSIATYENGNVTAKSIGNTTLIVRQEEIDTTIYIPIQVISENGTVTPNVQTGKDFSITLKADGTVWTFGTNTNGELGIGNNNNKNVPKQVELLADKVIKQISVGTSHVIALTEDGEIYTWGLNANGQLGIGNTKNSNIPQNVKIPESTELIQVVKNTIIKVIANNNVSYAISQSGKVYAWGEGYGLTPRLLEFENDIIDLSKSYALDINGNIYSLETNQRLEIVEKIKYISEGNTHTVFLSENGTAYAIGSNTYGQFGDGTNVSNESSVVAVRNEDLTDVLRNIVKIEAGNGYSAALLSDGKLLEWGINNNGQLGTDEIDETNTVKQNVHIAKLLQETNENIMLMDAGANQVSIALTDGNVYTWGLGEAGQLGNGANDNSTDIQLVGKNIVEANTNNLVLNVNDTFDINANTTYFNLLKDIDGKISYESKDETVVTVDATSGMATARSQGTTVIVAREVGTTNISVIQVRVLPEGINIEPQVSTNGSHTVTLKVDGTVWCYGNNTNGELGNGTINYSDEPVQAKFEEGTTIVQIAAGENFSVALDSEGYVWTWGANDYYQLGNNSSSYVSTPTKVQGISNITKIVAGTYSVLAVDENKQVYGWGLNSNGELGIGSYTNKVITPTKAKSMTDVIDIAVGKNHSILLKSTGEVYVTGLKLYGQLGNNDTSIKKLNTFTKVENLTSVARISATDSGNIVSTVNGQVYTWGLNIYGELGLGDKTNRYVPEQIKGISNIVAVSGRKNHSILLDKTGKVYLAGSNKYGQLGNGTTIESLTYQQITTLNDVMAISAGNTYTVIAKEDGTVWGFGDYNHGDTNLKSKTKSAVPIQVGNDTFGLGITKITIKKSETVNIASSMLYSFNLIYEDKNNKENITYKTLNEEIAIVNENGEVLGVKEGFTWIKVIEQDGTEHVVYVYVIDNEQQYNPAISAGEDFASVLKADGSIWTFGHNNNGELGIGSNKTKDVPEKTNVISSYREISSGNSFTIAIRNDRTVWSYGKNNYGQLGIGNTKNGLNPVQVNGLSHIVQIATGKEHAVALDEYGILYGWGNNNNSQLGLSKKTVLTPTPIGFTQGTISSIWAGENETIVINTKGEVYGYGSILNGKLEGIENAVKVSVGNGYMLVLMTDGKVCKYDGTNLTKLTLENIVDIDVTNENNVAQTVDEKIYTWTGNNMPLLENIENIYTIASGVNNTYVILTNGTVYAKGNNAYGQLGNSTRIDSKTFTLVGDRKFSIQPESAIMYVNDVELLTEKMTINEFNVFNRNIRNAKEYKWETSNSDVVTIADGKVTAIADGTANITVTDNVTGATLQLTRVVIPVEKDRLDIIKVNDMKAIVQDEYKYYVEVETNLNTATLELTTKNNTDKISIDGGLTWYENGTLTTAIDIPNEENEIAIVVETTNGTQIPYTLTVKKISTDVSLESITVDGIEATATSATTYEVVVPEDATLSEVIARANSNKSEVSINGEIYIPWKSITTIEYKNNLQMKLPIVVKAENGDELEYSLTIYKESSVLQLESLSVDKKEAIKTSEGVYSITISRDLSNVEVTAKAVSELVNVSLNSEDSEVQISTKQVAITDEITQVSIRLSTMVDGVEAYRDYTLNIYKKAESGNIEFVIVNGTVVSKNVDGTYEIYLPAETTKATVKVIAKNSEDYVQIDSFESSKASSEVEVETPNDSNKYIIKITDDVGNTEEHTLYINKPSVDNTLKEITLSNGDYTVTASKSTQEENVYTAKVKSYDNYTIKATTNNINAYVGIDGDTKAKNIATKVITKTDDYMEIVISVTSENGDLEEYTLKITVMSSDASLEFIKVNETLATLQTDGTYLVNLETAETKVSLTAQATSEQASIKANDNAYELHTTTKEVTIDSKDTTAYVYVQAEDGTTKKYTIVISGLPDDSTLQKVTVNGEVAKYIEGQNKYEIRSDSTEFNIEAIATDSLAKVALNGKESTLASATATVTKAGTTTTVTIKVTSQNGIDSSTYILEIKEKSSDSSIASVMVNGKEASKTEDGNYITSVVNNVTQATIKVETNDSYATVYLDDQTQNLNNITITKTISERETLYTIKVVAEDGTEEEHTLTITKLAGNTNIKELSVTTTKEIVAEETGEVTPTQNTEVLTPDESGNYYLKIDRIENVDVKAILEDVNASVKIKNSAYALAQNEVEVETVSEKTVVTISVQSEDGTIAEHTLTLEKKSNDTTLKTITSTNMLKLEDYTMYVDESLTQIDLTLVTNSDLASIKLDTDENYTPVTITRTIDISEQAKPEPTEENMEEGWKVSVEVQAEDGTTASYAITIVKTGNTNITTVKVNNETIANVNDVYTARVNVSDTANIEITTQNEQAKIEIIKETIDANTQETTETLIVSGKGSLNANIALEEDPQNYTIRITSSAGSTTKDYELVIEQKSTDTSTSYVKVNNLTAIQTADGNYISTVSGKEQYPLLIKANDEKASIKIAYKDYEGEYQQGKLEENVPVAEAETLEVTVTVKAENGNEQNYIVYITRISDNTTLEYIKVNGVTCVDFNESTNTYTTIVDNTLNASNIEVKAASETAKVTIGSKTETQILTTDIGLDGEGTTKTVTIKVEAEDGTLKEYYVKIIQLSANVSLNTITVNDTQATKVDETNYEVTISDKEAIAKIVANAKESTSSVSIASDTANVGSSTKTINIDGHAVIEMTITITAEDGTSQNYNLTINVVETSNKMSYVKVNTGTVEAEEGGLTYKTFIDYNATNADIEIKAESNYATIDITNKDSLAISNENEGSGLLTFTVDTPNNVTTINYSVTSETGETKEYSIILTKISTDNTLKELYVKEQLLEVAEDGNYYISLENPEQVNVKAIANNENAMIRIDYNAEEKQQTQASINAEKSQTKVTITITSQAGVTKKYYLYIKVLANNTNLDKVIVDSVEVTDFEETTNTYAAIVDNTKDTYEVFLMAVNDQATIELYDGEELISSGVGNLTDTVTLQTLQEAHNYQIKVSLDEEHISNYTLLIMRNSTDTSLKLVEVNDVVRKSTETDAYIYEVGIPQLATTAKIKVETTNSYATVRIGDHDAVKSGTTVMLDISLNEDRITVPVVVTAVDGKTVDTFNILLVRQSNDISLEYVKVNKQEIENIDDIYTYYMSEDEETAHVEISMVNNAIIEVDGNEGVGYLEFDEKFSQDTVKVEKIFKVTSEDGTVEKEYTLILMKQTQITGTILTENLEGKHISTVSLYKVGQKTPIKEIKTNEDGTYLLDIEEVGTYEVVVTKPGYLNYTITNIQILPGNIIKLGEYNLKAGDVASSGEIEIDDIVDLNDNFGVVITEENKEEKSIYDLNEDGKVDTLDRNILKKNYGRLEEKVEWVNPNAKNQKTLKKDFILPMNCSYVITSEYGNRVHPTKGVTKFHSGIDIVGEHHTQILAVADGEITYAGVQSGYGNCIEIKHTVNGVAVYTFYAHMSRLDVQVGQKVTQGQVIGLEGGASTDPNHGTSTGHHLHFEVRKATGSGNSLNPNDYIEF